MTYDDILYYYIHRNSLWAIVRGQLIRCQRRRCRRSLTYLTFPPQNWHSEPCQPSLHTHVPFLHTPPFMQLPPPKCISSRIRYEELELLLPPMSCRSLFRTWSSSSASMHLEAPNTDDEGDVLSAAPNPWVTSSSSSRSQSGRGAMMISVGLVHGDRSGEGAILCGRKYDYQHRTHNFAVATHQSWPR